MKVQSVLINWNYNMTDIKNYKLLPTGNDSFTEVISKNKYYVDKTLYLKSVFEDDGSAVLLFTRPRRFGKTLLMNMFADFLRIKDNTKNEEHTTSVDNTILFKDTSVMKDATFVEKHMGQYPVIFVSLKNVKGDNFTEAYENLAEEISNLANDFNYLLESDSLSDIEKRKIARLLDDEYLKDQNNKSVLTSSLKVLSKSLYKHFKRQTVILIDEYDVPLAKAAEKKYHDKMVTLMTSFFDVLKSTPSNTTRYSAPVFKVVMTGCLKVAKNSIFTGVNNVVVNTVLDTQSQFTSIIGFNKNETEKLLDDYNLADYKNMVRENYDGYRFDDAEMFCPWDVINFVSNNYKHKLNHQEYKIKPDNYWINTSSSEILKDYVGYLSSSVTQRLQDLVDRKTIEVCVNDSMNYDDLKLHDPDDFFSLLLHTGYLTAVGNTSENNYTVKIPNKEILDCFKANIKKAFDDSLTLGSDKKAESLATDFLEGNTAEIVKTLNSLLSSYVSIRDLATKSKPENFYHGFMSGIFTVSDRWIKEYKSNFEAGNGYADISFRSSDMSRVAVLELKSSSTEKDIKNVAEKALLQIEEKQYTREFLELPTVESVIIYGIAFFNKQCFIVSKKVL